MICNNYNGSLQAKCQNIAMVNVNQSFTFENDVIIILLKNYVLKYVQMMFI